MTLIPALVHVMNNDERYDLTIEAAILLGQIDLTLALPLCNSLAFVLTAITGYFLGEKVKSPWLLCLGTLMVLSGTALCTVSQTWD